MSETIKVPDGAVDIGDSYEAVRHLIETGDVIAFAGKSWLSKRIIKDDGKYSHIAMAIKIKLYEVDRLFLIHSEFPDGVKLKLLSKTLYKYKGTAWWVPLNNIKMSAINADYQKIMADAAMLALGKPYDWRGVLSYVIPWMKQDPAAVFCSEFYIETIAKILRNFGAAGKKPSDVVRLPVFDKPERLFF